MCYTFFKVVVVAMNNIPKFLMHITTEKNCDNIVATKSFNTSIHSDRSIQWLGDGVYFWDGNDDVAQDLGKVLVKHKPGNRNANIKRIMLLISIDESRYLNLDSEEWEKTFEKFLKEGFKEGKILLEMLKMYRNDEKNIPKNVKNQIGKMFGCAINLFIKILKEKNIEIDLVSHYFYHSYKTRLLAARQEMDIRQYCIKNLDLINNNPEKWYIDYI